MVSKYGMPPAANGPFVRRIGGCEGRRVVVVGCGGIPSPLLIGYSAYIQVCRLCVGNREWGRQPTGTHMQLSACATRSNAAVLIPKNKRPHGTIRQSTRITSHGIAAHRQIPTITSHRITGKWGQHSKFGPSGLLVSWHVSSRCLALTAERLGGSRCSGLCDVQCHS